MREGEISTELEPRGREQPPATGALVQGTVFSLFGDETKAQQAVFRPPILTQALRLAISGAQPPRRKLGTQGTLSTPCRFAHWLAVVENTN